MSDYFSNSEWKQTRLGKFTASEISKLLVSSKKKGEVFGKTALSYINEKVAEIVTGEAKSLDGIKALEWGAANEVDAIRLFQEQHDEPVEYFGGGNPQFFEFNSFSGGSPDGLTDTAVVEVKCPYNSANHIDFLLADNPNEWMQDNAWEYYCQIQFNMLCTGKERGFLVSYDPRAIQPHHRLAVLEIARNEPLQEEMTTKLEAAKQIVKSALERLESVVA
jgi:YqaJ-like viral recombinase domain